MKMEVTECISELLIPTYKSRWHYSQKTNTDRVIFILFYFWNCSTMCQRARNGYVSQELDQSAGWGRIKMVGSMNCFLMFYQGGFLNCVFHSRYRNHCSGTPAWLWERSDKNLVLQQETGPQEHCPNDVKRCGLVYKGSLIWKWRRKCNRHGISVWTVVSGGQISI